MMTEGGRWAMGDDGGGWWVMMTEDKCGWMGGSWCHGIVVPACDGQMVDYP